MACTRKKQCLYGDICPTARSDEYNLIDASCYKPLEQTNEEWFDTLSTKEKAEWLFKLTYKCYWCGREYTPRSPSLYNEKECPFKKCMKDKKDFEKWLKQPHKE